MLKTPDDTLYLFALEQDEIDPLGDFRERFELPADIVYMDGNSLGALPRSTRLRVNYTLREEWGQRLVRAWNHSWLDLPTRVGAKIAELIGADPDEVIVCDSTSVNFYKLAFAGAALQDGRTQVVSERGSFPTNRYILQQLFAQNQIRYVEEEADGISMPPERVEAELDSQVAMLCLNHVNYRSGWLHDMGRLNASAREVGALNLWDLSHSVGVVPLDLHASGTDLAVGCTYKYINGGPGAPAFLYVRRELQEKLANPIQGWFGQRDFFDFPEDYEPEVGMRRFLTGTPPILSMVAVESGLDIVLEAGVESLRRKSLLLSSYLIELWEQKLAPLGVRLNSPMEPENRGSHISLGHDRAMGIDAALIHRMGVIPDFRKPDNIRFGLAPLYNRFVDVYEAIERTRLILENKSYESVDLAGSIIT